MEKDDNLNSDDQESQQTDLDFNDSNTEDSTKVEDVEDLLMNSLEKNSLFQHSDDNSIDKYLLEISQENETLFSNVTEYPSIIQQSQDNDVLNYYSLRSNNFSSWNIISNNVQISLINYKTIECILYRESLLSKLKKFAALLDEKYWKYSVFRIKILECGDSIYNKILEKKRLKIQFLQNELSILIAHIRSLSLKIILNLLLLRKLIERQLKFSTSISLYWKNENYLLKISTDMDFLFEFQSLRYWIGFIPNPFMVPSYSLKTIISYNSDSIVPGFNKSSILYDTSCDPKSKWIDSTRTLQNHFNKLYEEKVAKKEYNNRRNGRNRIGANDLLLDRKFLLENLKIKTENSNQIENKLEDWNQLRDYCSFSWTKNICLTHQWPLCDSQIISEEEKIPFYFSEKCETWVQGLDQTPSFWNNYLQNPLVIEAAIGYPEIFPTFFIVPPLPHKLIRKCVKMMNILINEKLTTLKYSFFPSSNGNNSTNNTLPFALQYFPLSIIESGPDSGGSLHTFLSEEMNKLKIRQLSIEKLKQTTKSQLLQTKKFPVISGSNVIKEKIRESRSFVEKNNSLFSVPSYRHDKKAHKYVERFSKNWFRLHASIIQRIVRGFLGRRKVKRLITLKLWDKCIIVIQAIIRGFLQRIRLKRELKRIKLNTFYFRKQVLKKFKSALIITRFIRTLANIKRLNNNEPLFFDKLDEKCRPLNQKFTLYRLKSEFPKEFFLKIIHPDSPYRQILIGNEQYFDSDSILFKAKKIFTSKDTEEPIFLLSQTNSFDSTDHNQEIVLDQENSTLSKWTYCEAEKTRMERSAALALVKKLNKDRTPIDTLRTSRLIPKLQSQSQKKYCFARKEHIFIKFGEENSPASLIKSSYNVYLPPLSLNKKVGRIKLENLMNKSSRDTFKLSNSTIIEDKETKESEKIKEMLKGIF